jgi:hypothetical protein
LAGNRFSSGSEDVVARSAIRIIAGAGVLITGLLMGGAGIASGDPGDATGAEPETASVTSTADGDSDGATGASQPDPPTSTVGNGRADVDVKAADEEKKKNETSVRANRFRGSFSIPILRIPTRAELPASGFLDPALFLTTVEIQVPTLAEVFAAMQPQPQPAPVPGPAFRTQEEAPPVADSGGGGVDPLSIGVAARPPVLQAPMVIAPLSIPLAPAPRPVAPLGAAATAGPTQVTAADVAAAGVRAPVIRGSLPPTVQPVAPMAAPLTRATGQPTPVGYPRSLRNPTAGELALVALPGAVGLLVLTFSGGFIGYRQANSSRLIRAESAARFLR